MKGNDEVLSLVSMIPGYMYIYSFDIIFTQIGQTIRQDYVGTTQTIPLSQQMARSNLKLKRRSKFITFRICEDSFHPLEKLATW